MLHLKGIVGGSEHDGVINPDKLLSAAGVAIPKSGFIELELDKRRTSYDSVNKLVKFPVATLFPNKYSCVLDNGDSFELTYYTREVRRGSNVDRYVGNSTRVVFKGRRMRFDVTRDRDLVAFLLLSPWVDNSPCLNKDVKLVFVDVEGNTHAKIARERSLLQMKEAILNAPDSEVEMKAKAISVRRPNGTTAFIDTLGKTPTQLRIELLDLLEINPDEFSVKWDDPSLSYISALRKLIEDGVIISETKSGYTIWRWKENSSEIVRVPNASTDPIAALSVALDSLKSKVISMANNRNVLVQDTPSGEDRIDMLIRTGRLMFEPESMRIKDAEGNTIKKVTHPDRWVNELKEAYNSVKIISNKINKL